MESATCSRHDADVVCLWDLLKPYATARQTIGRLSITTDPSAVGVRAYLTSCYLQEHWLKNAREFRVVGTQHDDAVFFFQLLVNISNSLGVEVYEDYLSIADLCFYTPLFTRLALSGALLVFVPVSLLDAPV